MPIDKEVAKELKNLTKTWKQAQPVSVGGFQTVPDGEYVANITEMSVQKSKNGRLQVVTTFTIKGGEQDGSTVKRFDGLDNERSIGFFKGFAEVIGLDLPNDVTLLPSVLETFVGECEDSFEINVKTKNEFQNVYVNGVAETEGAEEEEEEGEEEEETEEEETEEEEEEEEEEPKPIKKPFKK